MNAASLWSGTEYAWAEYRPRGVFPTNAIKVKVIKVTKSKRIGNQNSSTDVLVQVLENNRYDTNKEKVVRARDIVNFWNEYVDERDHRIAERERRDMERREGLARARREQLEQEEKRTEQNNIIAAELEKRGFMKPGIHSMGTDTIRLYRESVMVWLGIS